MDAEKLRLAQIIDAWVQNIARQSSSDAQADEQILEGMHEYMEPCKQLLDTCTRLEMNLLVQRYDGFYRFANLLERLAQAIQDGVITVPTPPGRGKQARQQRTRKPKPNRRQNTQQIRRPITFLPTFTELIIGELAQTEEQYVSFAAARHKPYVLDDALVDRAMKAYTEQLAFITTTSLVAVGKHHRCAASPGQRFISQTASAARKNRGAAGPAGGTQTRRH